MKASSFGEGKEIKPELNYNYWGRQSSAHLSCRTAAQEEARSAAYAQGSCTSGEENLSSFSLSGANKQNAIIYYRPLHVIFPFDWRRTTAS